MTDHQPFASKNRSESNRAEIHNRDQARAGQLRAGQFRAGQFRAGQTRTGQTRTEQAPTEQRAFATDPELSAHALRESLQIGNRQLGNNNRLNAALPSAQRQRISLERRTARVVLNRLAQTAIAIALIVGALSLNTQFAPAVAGLQLLETAWSDNPSTVVLLTVITALLFTATHAVLYAIFKQALRKQRPAPTA